MPALVLALLLSAAAPAQTSESSFTFPAQRLDGMTATLSVQVPEQGPAPGRGRVTLTLQVSGPAALEVDEPILEDALAGWRVEWAGSSWTINKDRVSVVQTLQLVQIKPGAVPLPGVTLRLRASTSASWQSASWPEVLAEPRDVPPPVAVPPVPPSPWPARLVASGIVLAAALCLSLLVLVGQRWRAGRKRPLPAHDRALLRLDEMPADPVAAVLHLDTVLRRYLQERFGVEALARTNRELLAALTEEQSLPAEQAAALADLLSWCELAKFAGIAAGEGITETRARAREFVQRTAVMREEEQSGTR
jgi:hypothetical protein